MTKIGICLGSEYMYPFSNAPEKPTYCDLISYGYRALPYVGLDFIEVNISSVSQLSDAEMLRLCDEKVEVYAGNCFVPAELKIVELKPELEAYVAKATKRMAALGAKYVVFGSGGARNMPDGMTEREKTDALLAFLRIADKYAGENGLTVVIEPLSPQGSNVINTVLDGYALAREADLPNICLLADEAHLYNEPDNLAAIESLATAAPILRHVHLRDVNNHLWPGNSDTEYITKFLHQIENIGYTGALSFECGFGRYPDDIRKAIDFVRSVID